MSLPNIASESIVQTYPNLAVQGFEGRKKSKAKIDSLDLGDFVLMNRWSARKVFIFLLIIASSQFSNTKHLFFFFLVVCGYWLAGLLMRRKVLYRCVLNACA